MKQRLPLPVLVYTFDRRTKRYRLNACLKCAVEGPHLPDVLTSSAGMSILGENVELLKSAMRAPAVVLHNGTRTKAYNSACEEIGALPPMPSHWPILRAYELAHVNLNTLLANYRLRPDGALVLSSLEQLHCTMCYVPEEMQDLDSVRSHLHCRARAIRKLLRDRRIVVEKAASSVSVYSFETLRRCRKREQEEKQEGQDENI